MSSKLIAGNATNGSSLSADTTGILEIQTGSTPTTAITVGTSQNVGIGTASPNDKLDVTGNIRISSAGYFSIYNADNTTYSQIRDSGGAYVSQMEFFTAGTERMRIDNSGNLLVGTTSVPSGGQKMNIAGGITPSTDNSYIFGNSGLRWQALYATNGTIQTSDERDKTDIVDSPLGLDFICKVKPVAYKFKVGKNEVSVDENGNEVITPIAGTRQHFGVLAQQVKEVIGDVDFGGWILTDTKKADSAQGIRYDEFVAPLIKAIQELNAKVDAQAAEIKALKGVA
jgi:hypothetical protein